MSPEPFKAQSPRSGSSQAEIVPLPVVPAHVGIIMDGNGRWANARGLARTDGHRAGTDNIRRVLRHFARYGVKYVSLFIFSTENWNRPQDEVNALMHLLRDTIKKELEPLHAEGVRIRHVGRSYDLPPDLREAIDDAAALTKNNTSLTLGVAFNYGGRAEILDAIRRVVQDGIRPELITEELFGSYLYTGGFPDPDLIIRTAGEMRLSNFLIWQAAYAEYYTTQAFWPDFDEEEVTRSLVAFSRRTRRFGKVMTPPDSDR